MMLLDTCALLWLAHDQTRFSRKTLQSIDQAEKSEQALEKSSVEALMLKGMTILSINTAEARKKIVLIDHICISIFGKTELFGYPHPGDSPVTVKDFTSDDFA